MGTTYSVKYIDDGQIKIKPIEMHGQIEEILKEVNNKMSTYISTSELSQFNQNTQIDTPVEISADLAFVLRSDSFTWRHRRSIGCDCGTNCEFMGVWT